MTYNVRLVESPDAERAWYRRSGFIHPVYSPSGRVVTEGFPADHMHQHGLMFAWTSSAYEGHAVDFWNGAAQQGHIEHVETLRSGPDEIVVRLRHVDDTTAKPTVVLNETWQISRVPHESMHVFDLVSMQTCATEKPLEIRKSRLWRDVCSRAGRMAPGRAPMTTNEGKDRAQETIRGRTGW